MDKGMLKKISLAISESLAALSTQPFFPAPPDLHRPEYIRECSYDYGLKYLDLFLKRRNETTSVVVDRLVMAMGNKNLLEREPQFHSEMCSLPSWDMDFECFMRRVRELLFDSCFVIELFRKYAIKELRGTDDPIFNTPQNLHKVRRLLISIDHQIPFCFLVEFFDVTKDPADHRDDLINLALHFFKNMVGQPLHAFNPVIPSIHEIKHLPHLVHYALCSLSFRASTSFPLPLAETSITMEMEMEVELQFINYATELQEAGIKFKKMKGKYLLDIHFKNRVLEIPPLKVADNTLNLLQNLMEYEKTLHVSVPRNVNDYAKFMQCLVNSPKDVELLRRSGIIENWLGSDEEIFKRLNDLGSKAEISGSFTYSQILKKVNEHCGHRRNIWMANLWRNYFNSPWSLISFIAAAVLLLLTLTQTVFSILSYHPPG